MPTAKKARQFEIPSWVEAGKAIWVEIIDAAKEPCEYLQGTIKSIDPKTKQASILYVGSKGPDKVDADLVLQRNLEPEIKHDLCDVNP